MYGTKTSDIARDIWSDRGKIPHKSRLKVFADDKNNNNVPKRGLSDGMLPLNPVRFRIESFEFLGGFRCGGEKDYPISVSIYFADMFQLDRNATKIRHNQAVVWKRSAAILVA